MSSKKPKESIVIEQPIQLLVEGEDDKNFFKYFIKYLNLSNIQIESFGGKDNLPNFLSVFVKLPKFETTVKSIGIVRDADQNVEKAWENVKSSLENTELPVPDSAGQKSNNEPTNGNPTTNVFIFPDNKNKGMLETLLCQSIERDPVNECIDNFFQCLEKLEQSPKVERIHKARAHTYIATRSEPQVSVGIAAREGYWNFNHSVFDKLKAFLKDITPNK